MSENLSPHSYTADDINKWFDAHKWAFGQSPLMDWMREMALRGFDGPNDAQDAAKRNRTLEMVAVYIEDSTEPGPKELAASIRKMMDGIPATGSKSSNV